MRRKQFSRFNVVFRLKGRCFPLCTQWKLCSMIRIRKTILFFNESCFHPTLVTDADVIFPHFQSLQLFRLSPDNECFKLNLLACQTKTLDSIFGTLLSFCGWKSKNSKQWFGTRFVQVSLPFKTCSQFSTSFFVCLVYVTDSKVCLPKWNSQWGGCFVWLRH